MKPILFLTTALTLASPALAQMDLGMTAPEGPIPAVVRPIDSSTACLPPSALEGAEIVMLGQYGGHGERVPYQIKGAQHGTTITRVVGDPGRPVVIVASAYESTVWDFSGVPAGRIRGVYASGFYAQGVAGARGVPVALRHTSADNGADPDVDPTACPNTNFAYGGAKARSAAAAIRDAFGRYPSEFLGSGSAPTIDLSTHTVQSHLGQPQPTAIVAERPIVTTGPRSGHEGIRQMLQSGVLRSIATRDAEAWVAKGARFMPVSPMARMAPPAANRPGGVPYLRDPYLITRDVDKLPGGLGGALAVTFVIPEGVSAPMEAGHSDMYRLEGMSGVPATTGVPTMPSFYSTMTMSTRSDGPRALHHARWSSDGSLVVETMASSDRPGSGGDEGGLIGSLTGATANYDPYDRIRSMQRDRNTEAAAPITSPTIANAHGSTKGDMSPGAIVIGLILAGACGYAFTLWREWRAAQSSGETRHEETSATSVEPAIAPQAQDGPLPQADFPVAPGTMNQLSAMLEEAIDASHEDDSALALLRFRRTVAKALREPEYDEDLANELDDIAEIHISEIVATYLKAERRASGVDLSRIEAELRTATDRLSAKVEAIVSLQANRDATRLREHGEFLRSRHSPEDRLDPDD